MKFEITSLAAIAALSTAVTASPCSGHGGAGGFGGFGGGSAAPSGVAAPSGGFGGYAGPTGGASVAFPTGTATAPTTTSPAAVAAADEGDDEEQDEDSSSSSSDAAEATPSDSGDEASATASDSAPATTAAPATNGTGSTGASSGSGGSSVLDAPQTIAAGETFDGAGATFDRGVSCTGQAEGGDSDAVFILENGATLSNVVIGANQIEGVHCFGACKLENVVWDAVCEDAFTIKEQADGETTTITGGGATGAEDKVLQHNGGGSLAVSGFTVNTFGKLYRSCGNCDEMPTRSVTITDVTATDGDILCGINSNYGDTCTVSGGSQSGVKDICCEFEGNDTGDEPTKIGCGASAACNIGDAAGAAKRSIGSKFNKWM